MTAAEVTGTDGVVSKHWSRTVYLRQGRFFVVSVTVRTAAYPPLRSAYPRVYTTGRFKVREELQWLGVQDKHKQDAAGLCTPCCSGIATVLNLAAACNQAKQLQVQQGVQAVSACSTVHLRGRQQQKLLQEQYSGCAVGQQQQEADTEQQIQPWWSWLFTAARRRVSTDKPAEEGAVKVSCLQLGFSWTGCLRKTLASIASSVRHPARCRRSCTQPAVTAYEPADAASAPEVAAEYGLELQGKSGQAAGKLQVVQIDVIGYPLRL